MQPPQRGRPTIIRSAVENDIEALVRLASAFRDYLKQTTPTEAGFRPAFAVLLADPATEIVLACDSDGAAVGYVQSRYRYSGWVLGPEAELEDVFVDQASRGRGIGRQLVEHAIAQAQTRGCRSVGLNTNERNAAAVDLYRQLGFRAERARWHGGRQLWMTREIVP